MINKMEIRFAAIQSNEALARLSVASFIAACNPSLDVISEIEQFLKVFLTRLFMDITMMRLRK